VKLEQTGKKKMDDKNNKHLLIVDDDESMRAMLKRVLKNYNVELAEDGESAIRLLKTEHFDALLLDLKLPDMDGLEILNLVKGDPETADMPVVVVTARTDPNMLKGIEAANVLIIKPFSPDVLRNVIEIATHIVH
jgi:CheY-like chemotaxis protein